MRRQQGRVPYNHGNKPMHMTSLDRFSINTFQLSSIHILKAEAKTLRSPTTSSVTEFLNKLFSRFGLPATEISDNGSRFMSEQFAEFYRTNGIQHLRTAPYHPQSKCQAERFVNTLKRSLLKINEGENIAKPLQAFLQLIDQLIQVARCKENRRKMRTTLNLLHYP